MPPPHKRPRHRLRSHETFPATTPETPRRTTAETIRPPESGRATGRELNPLLRGALVASLTLLGGVVLTACLSTVETDAHPNDTSGLTGHAAQFDGWSALWTPPDAALVGEDGAFTLECWVRGTAPRGPSAVAGNRHFGGFGITWSHPELGLDRPTGWVNVTHVPGAQRKGYLLARPIRPWRWDRWTHLALTYDGRRARMFVDGALASETVGRGRARASLQPFFVGADPDSEGRPTQPFVGEIAALRVSRVARYAYDFEPPLRMHADAPATLLLDFEDADDPWRDRSPCARDVMVSGQPRRVPVR